MLKTHWLDNPTEMHAFAIDFASTLKGGEIIGLVGDLGAGKTSFVQGVAQALGVAEEVKSPTFILMQIFAAKKGGIRRICHADAYRLKDESELDAIGFEEYAGQKDTVTLVEWADRLPGLHHSEGYVEISIDFAPRGGRIIRLDRHRD